MTRSKLAFAACLATVATSATREVLRGGAERMYPSYLLEMPEAESPQPEVCELYCNCSDFSTCL